VISGSIPDLCVWRKFHWNGKTHVSTKIDHRKTAVETSYQYHVKKNHLKYKIKEFKIHPIKLVPAYSMKWMGFREEWLRNDRSKETWMNPTLTYFNYLFLLFQFQISLPTEMVPKSSQPSNPSWFTPKRFFFFFTLTFPFQFLSIFTISKNN
jgi:hypothetical protein